MIGRGISILNDVMGPVMRGPSSSHTAGPFFIGKAAREMLAGPLRSARIVFDPEGSFASVYRDQGSDAGFAAGLMGFSIIEEAFNDSLSLAREAGVGISFEVESLAENRNTEELHPNAVLIEAVAQAGRTLRLRAASIGGGQIRIDAVDGTPVSHDGSRVRLLVAGGSDCAAAELARSVVRTLGLEHIQIVDNSSDGPGRSALCQGTATALNTLFESLRATGRRAYLLPSTALIKYRGPDPLLDSVAALLEGGAAHAESLGQLGLTYEAHLLALSPEQVKSLMLDRWQVMAASVARGFASPNEPMRFLQPRAAAIRSAAIEGKLVCGGMLATAIAAALAVMETNSTRGVVCAAPTAGSAGIIPGVLFAFREEHGSSDERIVSALFAMGVVGVLATTRATFAAEVCGCAAETGVAAAMAAAGLVELGGGSMRDSLDAAALCLMNTLGLVCDPVQGAVEIPCHARNIAGVAHALAATDAALGGFRAVLPLDEVIDAMLHVGQQLPPALRCTSLGGLAATPTARRLPAQIVHSKR